MYSAVIPDETDRLVIFCIWRVCSIIGPDGSTALGIFSWQEDEAKRRSERGSVASNGDFMRN